MVPVESRGPHASGAAHTMLRSSRLSARTAGRLPKRHSVLSRLPKPASPTPEMTTVVPPWPGPPTGVSAASASVKKRKRSASAVAKSCPLSVSPTVATPTKPSGGVGVTQRIALSSRLSAGTVMLHASAHGAPKPSTPPAR